MIQWHLNFMGGRFPVCYFFYWLQRGEVYKWSFSFLLIILLEIKAEWTQIFQRLKDMYINKV